MSAWMDSMQAALDYVEDHLTDEIDVHDVAARAYVSAYHFQRIFSSMFGMPLGEYVRHRRLTLAAQELMQGMKVIDAAVKYGYDSPDSFTRAFRRFHGVLPSQVQLPGVTLRSLSPVKFTPKTEVGSSMEYRIEKKSSFTVVGYQRRFNSDTSYQEIPLWWEDQKQHSAVMGMFGVCIDSDGKDFDYLIADLYQPWQSVPEGCVTREIPGGTWAVFPCTLGTLQDVNTRMWRDWLPSCREYRLGGNYNLEFYYELNQDDPPASRVELWLPIVPA